MNLADTKAYAQWRKKFDPYFDPKYLSDQERKIQLADGFSVTAKTYAFTSDEGYFCRQSENEFFNSRGQMIYSWRSLDTLGYLSFFQHSNGNHYLIFRIDLYGYSLLEVESARDFHYVPSQSFQQDQKNFEETFIWCGAAYSAPKDLLAVDGCFWAYSGSTLILDFRDPFREHPAETWVDIRAKLDPGDKLYDDLNFSYWDESGNLYITAYHHETDQKKTLCLPSDQLTAWAR